MRKTGGFLSKIFDSFYRLKSKFRKNLFLTYPYVAVKSYHENVKPLRTSRDVPFSAYTVYRRTQSIDCMGVFEFAPGGKTAAASLWHSREQPRSYCAGRPESSRSKRFSRESSRRRSPGNGRARNDFRTITALMYVLSLRRGNGINQSESIARTSARLPGSHGFSTRPSHESESLNCSTR